jgi:hypothetical protein
MHQRDGDLSREEIGDPLLADIGAAGATPRSSDW